MPDDQILVKMSVVRQSRILKSTIWKGFEPLQPVRDKKLLNSSSKGPLSLLIPDEGPNSSKCQDVCYLTGCQDSKPFQFVILSTAYYTFQMLVYVDIDEKIIKKLAYDGTDS